MLFALGIFFTFWMDEEFGMGRNDLFINHFLVEDDKRSDEKPAKGKSHEQDHPLLLICLHFFHFHSLKILCQK